MNLIVGSNYLPYNPELKERAREMRNNPTLAEKKLWTEFLSKFNFRFYRQKIIYHYIVDFYCPKLKLVIEVDGDQHLIDENIDYDKERTKIFNSYYLKVIRFRNVEVFEEFDKVCTRIGEAMLEPPLNERGLADLY